MHSVINIVRMRARKKKNSPDNFLQIFGVILSGAISLIFAIVVISAAFIYSDFTQDLPSIENLPSLIEGPNSLSNQPTQFYDRSGNHLLLTLKNPMIEGTEYLEISTKEAKTSTNTNYSTSFPEYIIDGVIATSDPYFWEHPGFNIRPGYLQNQESMALYIVRTFLITDEPAGLKKSFRERLLAAQITAQFGREKVLEWYLNSNYYGNLAYGIDAAARLYLDKPANKLTLAEAALIIGIGNSPALNPFDTPQVAKENQILVIQEMLNQRVITPQEGLNATEEQLQIRSYPTQGWIFDGGEEAPAFLLKTIEQLQSQIPQERFQRGGYKVYTTLDFDAQRLATCVLTNQFQNVLPNFQVQEGVNPNCEAAFLIPSLTDPDLFPYDQISAEIVLIDSETGHILALSGLSSEDKILRYLSTHPSGSIATTFTYLTAFTRGMSPASLVWDIPTEDNLQKVENFKGEYSGPQRLRNAFANDYLVPALEVLNQIGYENVLRTANQFGINFQNQDLSKDKNGLEIFSDLDLLETTYAYSVFSNQGVLSGQIIHNDDHTPSNNIPANTIEPTTILRVTDIDHHVLIDWSKPKTRPIISPPLSYLVTNVLSDEVARWQSLGHPNALEIGRPAAAKMGRTHEGESNWTIGYIPGYTLGVWLGSLETDDEPPTNKQIDLLQNTTAGIWHAIFNDFSQDLTYQDFTIPSGISTLKVCDPSGLLPTEICPNIVDEVFLAGSEPIQTDTLYEEILINRFTNRRATVFSPPDTIEKRTFMRIPEVAKNWATQTGIEIPPTTYDSIPSETITNTHSHIISPEPFQIIKGEIPILGKASGNDFEGYRLQVGAGLNPQYWYQIGQDSSQPISNKELVKWNTEDLNGLYTIQLLVVDKDRNVERSTTYVTVDNRPPSIRITNPIPEETIFLAEYPMIVFQTEVEDELGIEEVIFYLNNRPIKSLYEPPFSVSWNTRVGNFTLVVEVRDLAGNISQDKINFSVK
jgi:membrane carboxypeptidase/penicillin-binding protein